jgi:hypothetical protein
MQHTLLRRRQESPIRPTAPAKTRFTGQGHSGMPQVVISTHSSSVSCPKGRRHSVQDPQQTLTVKRIMDGFVDDTTIWQNLANELEALSQGSIEIAARLKTAAQWWEQLCMPQGQLELPKCFYYLLHCIRCRRGGTTCYQRNLTSRSPPSKRRRPRRRHYSTMLHDISSHAWRTQNPSSNLQTPRQQRQENGTPDLSTTDLA